MKILESYRKILNETRFISKVSTFVVVILLLSEIFLSVKSYFSLFERKILFFIN